MNWDLHDELRHSLGDLLENMEADLQGIIAGIAAREQEEEADTALRQISTAMPAVIEFLPVATPAASRETAPPRADTEDAEDDDQTFDRGPVEGGNAPELPPAELRSTQPQHPLQLLPVNQPHSNRWLLIVTIAFVVVVLMPLVWIATP